ncbi:GNAT family N-acetyltransferase [Carnobacterium pleistocenium]|uniref:GNAT family N-acetyltransferase n=1 Tax=Carnobacterium pleistocenium TaxID=181073 RepID=UPI00054F898A|nr:GNAT family N-acetyltransferase [Carnobacterium pleistocenium]
MLVKYRNSQNKLALGLLSLMPKEHELKYLQQTMQRYQQNRNWEMYFWQEKEKYIGIIGIEVQEKEFVIRHLAVLPSFRGEGVGRAIISETQKIYGGYKMSAVDEIEAFIKAIY